MIIATVVIPNKDRKDTLDRAVDSILAQDNSNEVEIIIVDDNSSELYIPKSLRPHDKVLRNQHTVGAAVSRNIGIQNASGEIIYLLDSDDFFIHREFQKDYDECRLDNKIFYTDLAQTPALPSTVRIDNFFDYILFSHQGMCQTSTLFFPKHLNHFFDESLPKHQDWDFIYSFLCNGGAISKRIGSTFFDRSDKKSLSRITNHEKSNPWIYKLSSNTNLSNKDYEYIKYMLYSSSSKIFSTKQFIVESTKYYIARKVSILQLAKIIYKRVLH